MTYAYVCISIFKFSYIMANIITNESKHIQHCHNVTPSYLFLLSFLDILKANHLNTLGIFVTDINYIHRESTFYLNHPLPRPDVDAKCVQYTKSGRIQFEKIGCVSFAQSTVFYIFNFHPGQCHFYLSLTYRRRNRRGQRAGRNSGSMPCRCMICALIYGSNVSKNAGPIELH